EGRRLIKALNCSMGILSRRTSIEEPDISDLLAVSSLPYTGHLLAAITPSKRTPALVQHLLAQGRGGCVVALPPALATRDIVSQAYATGETDLATVALDSVSVRLLYAVKDVLGWKRSKAQAVPQAPKKLFEDPWGDIDSPIKAPL